MKKTITILASLALLSLCNFASAQDKQIFNHGAIGITALQGGFGIEAAMPITPYLQIRGGYSLAPIPISFKYNYNDNGTIYKVPVKLNLWTGGQGKFMLDIFPGSTTPFRFVVGAIFGSGKMVKGKIDLRDVVAPTDWGTAGSLNGVKYGSTDREGYGYFDINVPKVLPYLGVGFGRSVDVLNRVSFTCELGAAYTGGNDVVIYDYSNPNGPVGYSVTSQDFVEATKDNKDWDYEKVVDALINTPVLPILKVSLFVRLF